MLEFFRSRIGGLFGIIVVGLLSVAFAISFGTQSEGWGGGQAEQFAAIVMGTKITESAFNSAFHLEGGSGLEPDQAEAANLRRVVLSGLIERELLVAMADDLGISASADEAEKRIVKNDLYLTRSLDQLAARIENNFFLDPSVVARVLISDGHRLRQSFQNEKDQFDLEGYRKFVQYYLRTTEEMFVEQQRRELIAERMRQLIADSVSVSETEVRDAYERDHDTARLDYVRFIPSYYSDQLRPSPEELATWAEEHKDAVQQYYETNKYRYTNLEKMARARHILIKVAEDADEKADRSARARIDDLLAKVRAGKEFAALAREYSEDAASSVRGGDLGYTKRGQMVPEFDEAVFGMEPGAISDVVKTKYGYHVIKLEGFREGDVSLEQAAPEIAEGLYRKSKGEEMAKAAGEAFFEKLKAGETMESLVPKEEEGAAVGSQGTLGLKLLSSNDFTRFSKYISGIGAAPEIVSAAFQTEAEGALLPGLYQVRGDYYVARLKARNKPNDEEFATLREGLTESLLSMKQGAWLLERMREMRSQAEKQGKIEVLYTPPKAAAKEGPRQPGGKGPAGTAPRAPSEVPPAPRSGRASDGPEAE